MKLCLKKNCINYVVTPLLITNPILYFLRDLQDRISEADP